MEKKVSVRDLRPGMFIQDLNCGWMKHPFARNRFRIKDQATIDKIRSLGVEYVYIADEGVVEPDPEVPEDDPEPLPAMETAEEPPVRHRSVSVGEERFRALRVRAEATRLVTRIMTEVKLGRPLPMGEVDDTAEAILDSVARNKDALLSLGRLRDKDRYTFEHSVSVAVSAGAFGLSEGLNDQALHDLVVGALLHDLGKALTPARILHKPGKLTDDEYAVMRRHVSDSERLLRETPGIREDSVLAAAEHHERFDGTGYPRGLAGDAISLGGQITGICDVYDAITADRCYRRGQEPASVLRWLYEQGGSAFDDRLVQRFIRCVGIYPVGTLVGMSSGRLGVVVEPGKRGLLYPVVRTFYDTRVRRFIPPTRIDLSDDPEGDRIVSYESPEKWDVTPHLFME